MLRLHKEFGSGCATLEMATLRARRREGGLYAHRRWISVNLEVCFGKDFLGCVDALKDRGASGRQEQVAVRKVEL
jgi:hypothetical protein